MYKNKKIISRSTFLNKSKKFQHELQKNKKIKKISRELYILSDKINWSYQHKWMGEPLLQLPEDILKMENIIFDHKPEIIFEIGVCWGGLILYFDSISNSHNIKKILGIDIFTPKDLLKRIKNKASKKVIIKNFSSIDKSKIDFFKKIKNNKKTLIHLDSNHTHDHVLEELRIFDQVTTKGDVIVVGDTIINNIPDQKHRKREWSSKKNPMTALRQFLRENKKFKILEDYSKNLILSNNPYGHILKIKD